MGLQLLRLPKEVEMEDANFNSVNHDRKDVCVHMLVPVYTCIYR